MRMVSIWMPLFPIERLKRERGGWLRDDLPFALVGNGEHGLMLTAVNHAAIRDGLSPGFRLADARAITPKLLTAPADPEADRAFLIALARWCGRYSPCLNVDGEDGLWLDVTGVPHLFGGEHALLADMAYRLRRLGFKARLGLAETLGGAHALARFARTSPTILASSEIHEGLASLPVEALRLEADTIRLLKRLGLKRISDLYDLPRASLERRFRSREESEAVLKRLDQALGRREEPRKPLLPPSAFAARMPFPEPLITHEGIVAAVERLARELCEALAVKGRGARSLQLFLYRANGSAVLVEAGLSAPTRAPAHLLRLMQDKIATVDAGFGIDLMVLGAAATEPLSFTQESFAKKDNLERQELLVDRLANRLRREAVLRLFPKESHLPERAQGALCAAASSQPWPRLDAQHPPRPPLLLAVPEPLDVIAEIPEGPPIRFTWRRVRRRVTKAEGPERIAPEWWLPLMQGRVFGEPNPPHPPSHALGHPLPRGERDEGDAVSDFEPSPLAREGGEAERSLASPGEGDLGNSHPQPNPPPSRGMEKRTRDYYRIEDEEGHRYWVFRDGLYDDGTGRTPAWYLHGVFG